MPIRLATDLDRDHIRAVHLSAFPEGEGEIVAKLAIDLLCEETTPPTIALVAESGGAVVGHVAFSPLTMANNENWQGYILAPLGVVPDFQRSRLGSKLIESGRQILLTMGVHTLFVYGDPKYYCRFGFRTETAEPFIPPFKLQYPLGWQAISLNDCKKGESSGKIACVTALADPELW